MQGRGTAQRPVEALSELVGTEDAAQYPGVTPRTLEVWRCTKRHMIPYVKVGRLVRYRRADLDEWLNSRVVDAPREAA
jgi:excisionase family DNA binding protein